MIDSNRATPPAEDQGQTWNLVSDLASRFRFAVHLSIHLPAEQVGADLKALFQRYGAPLFLKRDNGSNLVNAAVDAVLAEFGVIPLNSPRYYPRYNGAIEYGQRELKAWFVQLAAWPLSLQASVTTAQTWINVRARRCLDGRSAQDVFLQGNRVFQAEYPLERRPVVKSWIEHGTHTILNSMNESSEVFRGIFIVHGAGLSFFVSFLCFVVIIPDYSLCCCDEISGVAT